MSEYPLLAHLTYSQKEQLVQEILQHHAQDGLTVVDFLYYINYRKYRSHRTYTEALMASDFLLPDGIALRLFLARIQAGSFFTFLWKKRVSLRAIPNLNGTDFVPFFLDSCARNMLPLRIFLYGAEEKESRGAKRKLELLFPEAEIFAQNGFEPLRDEFRAEILRDPTKHTILLVGLGTPRQELWIEENKKSLLPAKPIIFSVGGLLDFLSEKEKRSPRWIRKINGEWLYRALTQPRKNFRKALGSTCVFYDLIFPPKEQ